MEQSSTHPSRFSLWLVPKKEHRLFFGEQIENLAGACGMTGFDPHVTVFAFDAEGNVDEMAVWASTGITAFGLRVRGLRIGDDFFKALYISLGFHPSLRLLYRRFGKMSGPSPNPYRLDPHLSLLYGDLPAERKIELLSKVELPYETLFFDEVRLVRCGNRELGWRDIGAWQECLRIPLEEEKSGHAE